MKIEDIQHWRAQALEEISAVMEKDALEALQVRYLGRKGRLQELMPLLKEATPSERPALGRALNELKQALQKALAARADVLAAEPREAPSRFDVTLPGRWRPLGSLHPVTQISRRVCEIFRTMGFTVAEGPDIETVHHNFEALNTPPDHPSRDPQDTFYLDDGRLLRCHTSPVQVRVMESTKPPVRIVAPGRCYRRDTPDATHSPVFHQVEGLYVDRHVSLAELKGDLAYFARELMGPEVNIRMRPHFFPFTEPSVEVDFSCHMCAGRGCRVCKQSGWIEIAGAGMVDPNVFAAVGYDPEECTGYAFGLGVERVGMILHGIGDIRQFYENDVRFLAQF